MVEGLDGRMDGWMETSQPQTKFCGPPVISRDPLGFRLKQINVLEWPSPISN